MNLSIIRCAKIMCSRTILNGNRRRTMKCWQERSGIIRRDHNSMGQQHPSTHGVFRMNVALEGEIVRKLKPVFGYLHRNHEQIGEHTTYLGSMPYTDRLDYFCSMTNNWAYALSVEKLAGIEVPERAEYLLGIRAV